MSEDHNAIFQISEVDQVQISKSVKARGREQCRLTPTPHNNKEPAQLSQVIPNFLGVRVPEGRGGTNAAVVHSHTRTLNLRPRLPTAFRLNAPSGVR